MPDDRSNSILAHFARFIVRTCIRLYYSKIEISGRENISGSDSVLFVANHANSLIDPVIIGITANRPVHFLAKAPLFETPFFGSLLRALGMLPAYRASDDPSQVGNNLKSLGQAATLLNSGEAVGIFPEGKSHDSLKMDKVRSGAARIAIQAVQQGAKNLKIIPLGINYERKEQFRSAIWVQVGKPIDLKEWHSQILEDERNATRALTSEIGNRLKAAVIHLDDEQWEPFLPDLESLLPASQEQHDPIATLRQRKGIADAMNYFLVTDQTRAEAIASSIKLHREELASVGVDIRSDLFRLQATALFIRQAWDLLRLALGLIPALLGTLHNLIPFLLVRLIAWKLPEPNRSVISLKRLGIGLPIYATWYGFAWWRLEIYFLPWVATVWSFLMLLAGIFALSYWPRARKAGIFWWCELRMVLQKQKLKLLREKHLALRNRLGEMAVEYRRIQPGDTTTKQPRFGWQQLKRFAAWGTTCVAIAVLVSWSLAYFRQSQNFIMQQQGVDLKEMDAASLKPILEDEEAALVEVLIGLKQLEHKAQLFQADLISGRRGFYTQQDNDSIRQLLFSYMSYRTDLLRVLWKFQNYRDIGDDRLRLETFLLELTAGAALYESSFKVVTQFGQSPEAIRKLNEGEPLWEIPTGLYDMIRANLAAPKNQRLLKTALEHYDASQDRFAANNLVNSPTHALFHKMIQESRPNLAELAKLSESWKLAAPVKEASRLSKQAVYLGQSLVSTWVGNTRVRQPRQGKPLITPEQLEQLRRQLKPGDILLERQNWYLSRAFMPGFWAHAALYVGTTNDLVSMGLDQNPHVKKFWKKYAARDGSGHEHLIIEAVPQGVRMTTLEHCIGVADSAAVLRPRIPPDHLPIAIAQAFAHLGKPYDFEFDFFSTDKLVCTELVYRCCDNAVQFPLVEVMGRKTLPPTDVVRKFARERGKSQAQLEFVAFLDGEESQARAEFKDEESFARTINRPSLTWLQEK